MLSGVRQQSKLFTKSISQVSKDTIRHITIITMSQNQSHWK